MSRSPAILLNLPEREWRNWQTRQLEVLVGVKSRGGSSPLSRIYGQPGLAIRVALQALPERAADTSHSSIHVSLGIPGFYGVTLVMLLLAGTKTDEHLDSSVYEINLQRNDGLASLLSQIGPLSDFPLVSQQDPVSHRLVLDR